MYSNLQPPQTSLAKTAFFNSGKVHQINQNLPSRNQNELEKMKGLLNSQRIQLLCAGDKKTQSKDIKLAKEYLKDYLEGENHG